ncbi:MAG: hypothetical protein KC635_29580 [Myxococcales bacterium]|nr:hypothetical protein [Myxococcales bacterium]
MKPTRAVRPAPLAVALLGAALIVACDSGGGGGGGGGGTRAFDADVDDAGGTTNTGAGTTSAAPDTVTPVNGVSAATTGLASFAAVTLTARQLSYSDTRVVLTDAAESPSVCDMRRDERRPPVGDARALYLLLDMVVDWDGGCRAASATSLTWRRYVAGELREEAAATVASAAGVYVDGGCRLAIEARFPDGTVFSSTVWMPLLGESGEVCISL